MKANISLFNGNTPLININYNIVETILNDNITPTNISNIKMLELLITRNDTSIYDILYNFYINKTELKIKISFIDNMMTNAHEYTSYIRDILPFIKIEKDKPILMKIKFLINI